MPPAESPITTNGKPTRETMQIVIGGHVDHGKSTVIGRLLADTGSLPEGKLEAVRALCERTSRPFEYAFLLDALKDEQAQGITIDSARVFFKTARRDYIILDAPGHIEFLKNMVTGASRAEAALLVIDAKEGIRENSRRHGYMMAMLGIRQFMVLVNKMDLVDYDRAVFDRIATDYSAFLAEIGLRPAGFIPIAAREGEGLVRRSERLTWYEGPTVLEALDGFRPEPSLEDKPLRMPVQDVSKFTLENDDRRIVAGTIETGRISVGDEVVFFPSGKRSRVKSIESFNRPPADNASAGQATGFTLQEQVYVTRGEVAALANESRPHVATRLRVSLFWLGKQPMVRGKNYHLKLGTAKIPMQVEEIHRVIDASTLAVTEGKGQIERHEVAECTLRLRRPVAVDLPDEVPVTGRFVVVDDYEIRGGGIVRETLPDNQTAARDKVWLRNYKWESSFIPPEQRAERYSQKPVLLLITGERDVDRKQIAKELESRLFAEGRVVYFLGIANVLYGVDADLGRAREDRTEHMRRLGEVANLMLDAGVILIVTAAELTQEDLELITTSVEPDSIETVWVGARVSTDVTFDLQLESGEDVAGGVERLHRLLQDARVLG
jgi:bifunctional enzyme CysN/CysC